MGTLTDPQLEYRILRMLVVEHSHLRGVHTQSELSHIKVKTLHSITC